MKDKSKNIYNCLSKYGKIASPQIHSYNADDLLVRSFHFSFRIEGWDFCSHKYMALVNSICNFENGQLNWVMYNFKSRKNYTIEPLLFYSARRLGGHISDRKILEYLGEQEYILNMKKAIEDVEGLCLCIEKALEEHLDV